MQLNVMLEIVFRWQQYSGLLMRWLLLSIDWQGKNKNKKVEKVPLELYCAHLLLPSLHQYLLAMTFVYFKRACFAITEYTTKNFFLAL